MYPVDLENNERSCEYSSIAELSKSLSCLSDNRSGRCGQCVRPIKHLKSRRVKKNYCQKFKKIVISGKSMRVRPESVTHLVVKLFNVKSKFDYIDKNKQKSEIANDKFEKRN